MLKIYNKTKRPWRIPCWGIAMLIFLTSFMPGRVLSQDLKLIKGTVTEASNGQPLPGVSVKVKGTTRAVSTNNQGQYSIQARNTDVLVFSFVGSKMQEIGVGSKTTVDVRLIDDATSLDETVIIGYGSVQKKDLTGSVGQVNIADLSKAPVGSFAEALAGRVSGVQVTANDGQPGAGINIFIRGVGSLTQSSSPLFVIDGFPIEDLDPATLNPEEIESMTVLKDASSTSVYGSRGANGVILIQTKRGKVGKPVVTLNSSLGFSATPKPMEVMSPYEFVKYQAELNPTNANVTAFFAYDKALGRQKTLEDYRNVEGINFQDYMLRTGAVQIHNLAVRGGNEQTQYSVSGSYYDQKGVMINTGINRYTGSIKLDQTLSNKFKVGISGTYNVIEQNGQGISSSGISASNPTTFILPRAWMYRPISADPGDDLLNETADDEAVTASDIRINPVIDLENQHQIFKTNVLRADGYISYQITKDLSIKSTAGLSHDRRLTEQFYNSKTSQGRISSTNSTNLVNGFVRNNFLNSFSNENTLNYKKTFNKVHTLTGLALFSVNSFNSSTNAYGGRQLPNESLGMDGLDEGIVFNQDIGSSKNTMVSYAGRLDYNYKSKYILTAAFRADGSSKFVSHWGYFPAAALAWNMQNEGFFSKSLPFISTSKLRLSFGSNGNNRIGDFANYARLTQSLDGYSFKNGTPIGSVYVSAVANPDLQWETTTQMDLGYEIGFLKDNISLEFDLYRKTVSDLLLNAALPPTSGFSTAVKNIGKLRNEGMEFTLHTNNITTKSFTWQSSLNISFNRNKIMELTRGQQSLPTNAAYVSQFGKPLYLAEIGKPAGMMIGYIWEGNYQYADFDEPSPGVYILKPSVPTNGAVRNTIQPGDIKYKDLNGDGVMNDADVTFIGRGQPIHIGGFSNNFTYKGFGLNVFFQWSYGNDIYNANRLLLEGNSNGYALINQFASYANRWSPENQTNENYRTRGQGPIGFHSSRVVEDGSFLRLKTVALNYNIPAKYLKSLYLSNLSLNVAAQNLITWTKYSGMDPEVSTRNPILTPGYDYSSYPKSPTVVFGLKAAF
ncbi:TonB-linked SusC/RagA family outer membrane protein [Pedobacter sp. AK017]|uniref:SusC/RagA family TonB-linked outer membrane protein n=1 Tax=Pedobacter sp. AK017 TaxID=2723073 RepID=UPI0017FDA56E|nr:TonB-dependent receptor [Pedobacter sp. AK017]MBB5439941.1 TonB-linked SusC/RagA family outer membrane protein [Pedobacter sp. AK017]